MKRFLYLLFLGLFVGNAINAAALRPYVIAGQENARDTASYIIDNIREIDVTPFCGQFTEQQKKILYSEFLGQARLRWPYAEWWDICDFGGHCFSATLSADGSTLAIGAISGHIRVYRKVALNEWCLDFFEEVMFGFVKSVSLSADGKLLAIGTDEGFAKIYQKKEPGGWVLVKHFKAKYLNGSVTSVALNADGSVFVFGLGSGIEIYEKIEGEWCFKYCWHVPSGSGLDSVALCSDGGVVVASIQVRSGTVNGKFTVNIYQRTSPGKWEFKQSFDKDNNGHCCVVNSVALNADGSVIVSGSHDKTVRVYQRIGQGEWEVSYFFDANYSVKSVALSADGRILAVVGWGGVIKIYHSTKNKELELKNIFKECKYAVTNSVALSGDGSMLAGITKDQLMIYNLCKLWD